MTTRGPHPAILPNLIMDEPTRQLITAVHNQPHRVVLVTAGAGTQALADLLAVAGASRTLLEAVIPYSAGAFNDFLGYPPEKYVASDTAVALAGCALSRGQQLAPGSTTIGLACTATISTDYPKRGEHHAHIAVWQPSQVEVHDLYLEKGARSREEEERLISNLMLSLLAQTIGLAERLPVTLTPTDRLTTSGTQFYPHAHQLTAGQIPFFGIGPNGRILTSPPAAILSGSFNPLHEGHLQLAQVAAQYLGLPVAFECTAVNADKPPLSPETLLARLAQFAGRRLVFASTAPTFVEKSRLFPGIPFVLGYDTAVRILQPRFYQNDAKVMDQALQEIKERGNTFLVAGRWGTDGVYHQLDELDIPSPYKALFRPLPSEYFSPDISSTQLRTKATD